MMKHTIELPDGTWTSQGNGRWTNPEYPPSFASRSMLDLMNVWADRIF